MEFTQDIKVMMKVLAEEYDTYLNDYSMEKVVKKYKKSIHTIASDFAKYRKQVEAKESEATIEKTKEIMDKWALIMGYCKTSWHMA